jgi:sodium transport system permease protein
MKATTIFLKEMTDLLRDRRSLFSALAYVLFGPVAVMFAVGMLAAQTREEALTPVALCGAGRAPALVQHLTAAGLAFDAKAKICLNIPEDFAARLEDGRTVRVGILADLATSGPTVRRLERALRSFSAQLASQRLIARGIAPSVGSPIDVDTQSTNVVSRQSDVVARILIIFFVSAPFFVSLAAAADMTAGERERRSLETLLAHPVGAFSIVLGKWLAAAVLGVFGTAACVVGGLLLLDRSALPELGVRLDTSVEAGLHVVLFLMPLCGLVAAVQLAVGLWAKNFKDAQSYLTLLSFAPVVAGFVVTGERLAQAGVYPLAWELNALAQPLLRSSTPVAPFGQLAAIEIALTFALLIVCALRLRSEKILSQA